eukprot:1431820-Amphidinium_carterae.1
MERAVRSRRQMLDEHLLGVPETVRLNGGPNAVRTRDQIRFQEETEEVAMFRARELSRVAEYEHSVAHENNKPRGFSLEESQAACTTAEQELRRYRQADARRQQQQFSDLQCT